MYIYIRLNLTTSRYYTSQYTRVAASLLNVAPFVVKRRQENAIIGAPDSNEDRLCFSVISLTSIPFYWNISILHFWCCNSNMFLVSQRTSWKKIHNRICIDQTRVWIWKTNFKTLHQCNTTKAWLKFTFSTFGQPIWRHHQLSCKWCFSLKM